MMTASWHPYTLHFRRSAGTSRGVLHDRQVYFLRLADGLDRAGWGECGPLKGLSVDDGPGFVQEVDRVCRLINRGQPPETLDLSASPALAFGLETALRDLGNGGGGRLFDTDFSRGQALLPTHGLIWMDSREGVLRQVTEKVSQGFTCIKMKVGALDFGEECALLADVRRLYPADQIELRLDANGAFAPEETLQRLGQLAAFDVRFLEQPIAAGRGPVMAELCAVSPVPIALDEELIGIHDDDGCRALLETVRPQHIVLKPTLLGGLAAAQAWIRLAQELGIDWWINSALESNVGLNAICQWTGSLKSDRVHGLGTGRLFTNNIPSPIRLAGTGLIYDISAAWDYSRVVGGEGRGGE